VADRMTKKEKREAAKRARMEAQRRAAKQRVKRRIFSGGAVVVVIALVVFFVIQAQQGSRERIEALNTLAQEGNCSTLESHSEEGRSHVPETAPVNYSTNPPTSGDHFGGTSTTGVHTTPPPDGNLVHNMEHGHVIFWYQPSADPGVASALTEVVLKDPTRRLLVPRESMPQPVAFTVWGTSMTCDGTASAEKIAATAEEFAKVEGGKGPEGDLPGQPGPMTGG